MPRRSHLLLPLLVMAGMIVSWRVAADDAPAVAVSIKPVHSLVTAIMAGAGEPSLIVKGGHSPHTYSLKPSDARNLNRADIVIWTGPGLELFLTKPIHALAGKAKVVTLIDAPSADPHVWLSPALAASIVERIVAALVASDPVREKIYRTNAASLKKRLENLKAFGNARLDGLRKISFLVFHDAWGHFAGAFGLGIAGAVALNPERVAGAKKVTAIRRLIKDSGARCLFREPQFESPLLNTVLEDQDDMRVFELDPLGSSLKPGAGLYFHMMEDNINAVASCLESKEPSQ